MSEEMTEHVISAIVDQIPQEHLEMAYAMVERKLGWQSVYVIDASMWCFANAIEDRVDSTLTEIGKFSEANKKYWIEVCQSEWERQFKSTDAVLCSYDSYITDWVCQQIQQEISDGFKSSDDIHDLMRDTILKHYGVQQ